MMVSLIFVPIRGVPILYGVPLLYDVPASTANHGEQHLEALLGVEGVGHAGGHDEHFAGFGVVGHTAEEDFGFAVEDGDGGVEGGGVFGEALTLVEGKEGEGAGSVAQDFARHDAALGIIYAGFGSEDAAFFDYCYY